MKVPVNEYNQIDYNGNVFILKFDENGQKVSFNCDGVMCRYVSMHAKLLYSFKSRSKYFNPVFWNTRTSLTSNNKSIYFRDKNINSLTNRQFDKLYKKGKITEIADLNAKSVIYILHRIKKEVEKNLNLEIEFDFDINTGYGKGWTEAYIPIKIAGEYCFLTWENCD